MFLAIDIGNTNTVFALYDNADDISAMWRCETIASKTADEYAAFLKPLFAMENTSFDDISFVLVGCVVPEAERHIIGFSKKYLPRDPVFVSAENISVNVDLPVPSQVGADRLINAVAVVQDYALPAVVVDFGTATTFDVIGADGSYLGGSIAPGIRLSIDALSKATAKLPHVNVVKSERAIAKSTDEAIQSGIFWGYVGLIQGILGKIKSEMPDGVRSVIATGGLAPLFADYIDDLDCADETLTLKGLLAIYKEMR